MHVRRVHQAMGHEIATPRPATLKAMVADPTRCTAQVGEDRGTAGEELEVEHGIDFLTTHSKQAANHADEGGQQPSRRHGNHVLRRHDLQQVKDRPVLLQHHEEDVLGAHALDGGPQRWIGQHRGPLLDEFEKQDALDRARG